MSDTARVVFRLAIAAMLSISLWVINASVASTGQAERSMPVTVVRQLAPVSKLAPADLRCGVAHISVNNELEFHCSLKNNSKKIITAASVTYAVVIETDGVETKDENNSVSISLGAQIKGIDKGTVPGGELSIGPAGPISYNHSVIKAVEVSVDFVEFDGDTRLGESDRGAQMVKDFREGAAKYKDWVAKKYKDNAKSINSLVPVLENEDVPN
ncbi:MAG: hypothetical protein QOF61_2970 [Acidobacteriota bacterium]|nr:hypothetical protein [Acidobacteriota bacterium]